MGATIAAIRSANPSTSDVVHDPIEGHERRGHKCNDQNITVVPAKAKSPDERRAAATSAHTANPITAYNEITQSPMT